MARHREGAVVYAALDAQKAKDDFWRELDHRCLDKGLQPGAVALSEFTSIEAQAIRRYRAGKVVMQITTLQEWCKALKPSIVVVLRFLGYTDKEIRAFAKEVAE